MDKCICIVAAQIAAHCDACEEREKEREARIDEIVARLINGEDFMLMDGTKIDQRDLIERVTDKSAFYDEIMPVMISMTNSRFISDAACHVMSEAIRIAAADIAEEIADKYRLVGV